MPDLVITGGTLVDGTGAPRHGPPTSRSTTGSSPKSRKRVALPGRTRSARSMPTASSSPPGFVDIHTHFDGQITWDPLLTPTCWHGVTTVVIGNCGVGFAPARPDKTRLAHRTDGRRRGHPRRRALRGHPVGLGVLPRVSRRGRAGPEVPRRRLADPPRRGARLRDGRPRREERARDRRRHRRDGRHRARSDRRGRARRLDVAHHRAHGDRRRAGARARSPPKTSCSASAARSRDAGGGIFELAPAGALGEDLAAPDREMDWMRRLSAAIDRPVTFALTQNDHDPDSWRRMLELAGDARAEGARVRPQVAGRPVTLLLGLETFHPFAYCPSWAELGLLPLAERVATHPSRPRAAARASSRRRPTPDPAMLQFLDPAKAFPLGDPPNYEPDPSDERRRAGRGDGRDAYELYLELLLGERRPRAHHAAAPQLHRHQPRRGARDAAAPHERVGSRRRRRALRHDLRRVDPDVHAHALGARPRSRPAPPRMGRAQDDRPRPRRSTASATAARSRRACAPTST